MLDLTALWAFAGIAVPQYVRARRKVRRRVLIPPAILKQYHQSDAWRARKTAYNRHHPKVCVACLWSFPLAYLGWILALPWRIAAKVLFPIRRPLRWIAKFIGRLFKRNTLELHHMRPDRLWDPELHILRPGVERNRELMRLCTSIPIASRVCGGCSHHAAADRIRRFCERRGLPAVAMTRAWVVKCWAVQLGVFAIIVKLIVR